MFITDKKWYFLFILHIVFFYSNHKKRKDAHDHKQSLEQLKTKDPELYEFLQKEDKTLLQFDPDEMSESG